MGPGIFPETTVCKHNLPCHLQMPTKALSCKKEAICDMCPVGQGSFKMDCFLPACYQRSVQKPASLMVWGCISAYGMGSLHVLEGTMNAERYIKVLEQHMLPSRRRLFQGRPYVFQKDNAKPHTAALTTAWLHSRRVQVLNWPACSPGAPFINVAYTQNGHRNMRMRFTTHIS